MAWGNTVGVASWVERLKRNDPGLTSVTVFRGRLFGPEEAAEVCEALKSNSHLRELYASGHKMDAATAGLFADMLAVNTSLRSLCIGDPEFGDEGLAALTRGIASSASLEAIDLENKGVGDEGAKALGEALSSGGCNALTNLNLARNDALGEVGIVAVCAGAVSGDTLESLTLAGVSLSDGACRALGDLLASSCPLKTLDLTGATVGETGAARIGEGLAARGHEGRRLDALVMDSVALGDAGVVALVGAGGCLPVVALSLQGCGIGEEGGVAIAGMMRSTDNKNGDIVVEVLNLRDNRIGDAGALALAAALGEEGSRIVDDEGITITGGGGDHGLRGVRVLDVGSNGLGPAGASELVRHASTTLQNLSLFGNEAISDNGIDGILEAAGAGTAGGASSFLRVLDIGGCGVEEAGLVRACEVLMRTAPPSDADADADGRMAERGDGINAGDDAPDESLSLSFSLFPELETLVVGGNPGVQGDAWEVTLGRLRDVRPRLDVAWRAADAGDDHQSRQQGQQLLEQYRGLERQQGGKEEEN